jgi:hypothetical protein
MNHIRSVGLDIHPKTIRSCVPQSDGTILQENTRAATRSALETWMRQLPQPWTAEMEATMFSGGIYHYRSILRPIRFPISARVARSGLPNRSFLRKLRSQNTILRGQILVRAATAPGSPNRVTLRQAIAPTFCPHSDCLSYSGRGSFWVFSPNGVEHFFAGR